MNQRNHRNLESYIFIDESGKPEIYTVKGVNLVEAGTASRFLVLAAVRTADQLQLQQRVTEFRLSLLHDAALRQKFSSAYTLDSFHAQVDYPEVKERFYRYINTLDVKITVLVVEKLLCYPQLRQRPEKLYGVMAGQLLKSLCHHAEKTEIIFSRKDSKLRLRQELEGEVERVRLEYLAKHPTINPEISLSYFHSPHYSHGGLQVADYIASAVYQIFERNNDRWFQLIKDTIGTIHDICNKKYFTRSNPLQLSIEGSANFARFVKRIALSEVRATTV